MQMRAVEARRDLRRWQETETRFLHAVIVSLFFFIGVGASLFIGAVMVIGKFRSNGSPSELTADGRTARIARTLHDGKSCHYILFDNRTAQAIEDRIGRCDEGKPKPKKETPATFSWGR
jgi:hypothetical protein